MTNPTEQMLLEKQKRRIDRVNAIRSVARKVACPKCKAGPGDFCKNSKGHPRISSHRERNESALEQGLLVRLKGRRPDGGVIGIASDLRGVSQTEADLRIVQV